MVENSVGKAVSPAFPACEVKVVYSSKPAFQGISVKDEIPAHSQANVMLLILVPVRSPVGPVCGENDTAS